MPIQPFSFVVKGEARHGLQMFGTQMRAPHRGITLPSIFKDETVSHGLNNQSSQPCLPGIGLTFIQIYIKFSTFKDS